MVFKENLLSMAQYRLNLHAICCLFYYVITVMIAGILQFISNNDVPISYSCCFLVKTKLKLRLHVNFLAILVAFDLKV